jgi:aminopeptidase N
MHRLPLALAVALLLVTGDAAAQQQKTPTKSSTKTKTPTRATTKAPAAKAPATKSTTKAGTSTKTKSKAPTTKAAAPRRAVAPPVPRQPAAVPIEAAEFHTYRPGIDVLDYAFLIDLPDTGATIRGDAMITLRRTARVDTLVLDLRALRVTRVTVDGRVRRYTRDDSTIRISMPRGDSGTFRVGVQYAGRVTDGLIARRDSARRWTYFGDNWPNRARHWLPTVDHPSDKATVTWSVTGPRGRTVVANGTLVETRTTGTGRRARVTTRWREAKPIPPYLMVIGAGPMVRTALGETACGLTDVGRCVTQHVYTTPEHRRTLPGNFAKAGEIVRWLASTIAPFPYEKLAHVESATRFGGMENASAIFYDDDPFKGDGVRESTIAHEIAHQWFGDAVTAREWSHIWLSEGFATYFAAAWTQHAHGDSAFRVDLTSLRQRILDDTVAVPQRPVLDTTETDLTRLLNRNSYDKGGFVLHMLRKESGDTAFFAGLKDYYTKHKHSTALTSDLIAAMERASGKPLGGFVDQWLKRPGYPELDVEWFTDSLSQNIFLTVAQSKRFGLFEFPLRFALADSVGATRRIEISIPAQDTTKVALPISGPVHRVEVDPDVHLLARITVKKGS